MTRRRDVLRWGLVGALGAAAPATAAVLASQRPVTRQPLVPVTPSPGPTASPGQPPPGAFTVPLPVPEVLTPVSTADGVDRYEIRQREGRQRIRSDAETTIWGYEGRFPGPTIETRAGRRVEVTHYNELPVPTVVHLHGAVAQAEHDGFPSDFVLPEAGDWASDPLVRAHAAHGVGGVTTGSRTYVYPNEQRATLLWYHDHRMDFSGPQQYRGLAGFYLIRDEVEDELPLPRGERELLLMLADRAFDDSGELFYPSLDPTLHLPGVEMEYHWSGMLGDTVTVNGVAWPFCEVDAAMYRLRLVNASNARRYQLALDPPPPGGGGFIQIGSDLGLLDRPVRHDTFLISPGERYDVVVDFNAYAPGTEVLLRNLSEAGPTGYVMRFDVARRASDDATVPAVLQPDLPPLPVPNRPADRSFSFFSGPDGTGAPALVNTRPYAADRIDAQVALGSTEIWNLTADPDHPVHLHLAGFRVLSRDGGPPHPQDVGVKDTVFVPEGGVQVEVSFTGYRGKYVFHCHNLEHADAGMMANLEIV